MARRRKGRGNSSVGQTPGTCEWYHAAQWCHRRSGGTKGGKKVSKSGEGGRSGEGGNNRKTTSPIRETRRGKSHRTSGKRGDQRGRPWKVSMTEGQGIMPLRRTKKTKKPSRVWCVNGTMGLFKKSKTKGSWETGKRGRDMLLLKKLQQGEGGDVGGVQKEKVLGGRETLEKGVGLVKRRGTRGGRF